MLFLFSSFLIHGISDFSLSLVPTIIYWRIENKNLGWHEKTWQRWKSCVKVGRCQAGHICASNAYRMSLLISSHIPGNRVYAGLGEKRRGAWHGTSTQGQTFIPMLPGCQEPGVYGRTVIA